MCSYEEVIKQDTEAVLREHYGYGEHSIKQFWELEGESICSEAYKAITENIVEKTTNYELIIGDTNL